MQLCRRPRRGRRPGSQLQRAVGHRLGHGPQRPPPAAGDARAGRGRRRPPPPASGTAARASGRQPPPGARRRAGPASTRQPAEQGAGRRHRDLLAQHGPHHELEGVPRAGHPQARPPAHQRGQCRVGADDRRHGGRIEVQVEQVPAAPRQRVELCRGDRPGRLDAQHDVGEPSSDRGRASGSPPPSRRAARPAGSGAPPGRRPPPRARPGRPRKPISPAASKGGV